MCRQLPWHKHLAWRGRGSSTHHSTCFACSTCDAPRAFLEVGGERWRDAAGCCAAATPTLCVCLCSVALAGLSSLQMD